VSSERRSLLEWLRRPRSTPAPGSSAPTVGAEPGSSEPSGAGEPRASRWDEVLRVQARTLTLLARKATPGELFRHIVEGAADSLGADEASLMLLDGDELHIVSASGPPPAADWSHPTRLGEGVAGVVAQTGTPVLLNEGDDLSRFPKLVPKGKRIASSLSVPLEVGGRVVGVLNANRLGHGERFAPEDLAVLRLFAATAALAIDQTNLLRRTQSRARALDTLLTVTETLAGDAEPAAALTAFMPRLAAAFHPAQALAFLGAGESGHLDAVAGWSRASGTCAPTELHGTALRLTDEITRLLDQREPRWLEALPLAGIPAPLDPLPARLLVVPIGEGRTISRCALVLGWDATDVALSSEDLRVLEGLARQIALALSREDRAAAAGALEAEIAQARAHLVEMERLATIGQSMAGLVHDVNAPLTATITLAQLIQKESTEAHTRERAGHIAEAARRAQRLVRELLTMARPQAPTLESVDLHALLRSAMDLERAQCSASGLRLVADFEPDLPLVTADPHRLSQVVTNLLVNARQAMDTAEKGNAITVRTRRREDTVEVYLADDGPGIPPTLRAKVFDWFYTTKPPGEGTGLGLAVSREILLAHGGNLRLEETPGGGATFVLELPCGQALAA